MLIKGKYLMLFIIASFSAFSLSAMGLGDWDEQTRNGTNFGNPGNGIYMGNQSGFSLKNISEWYFYKDHIIGYTNGSERIYFVANELSGEILKFKESNQWENYLKKSKLKPKLITRWFDRSWNKINFILLLSILYFPVTLIILIIYLFTLFRWISKGNYRELSESKIFLITLPVIFFLIALYGEFPGSI